MNAEVNVVSERALHPLAVNSESLQVPGALVEVQWNASDQRT